MAPNNCVKLGELVHVASLSEWLCHYDHRKLSCKADASHTVSVCMNVNEYQFSGQITVKSPLALPGPSFDHLAGANPTIPTRVADCNPSCAVEIAADWPSNSHGSRLGISTWWV